MARKKSYGKKPAETMRQRQLRLLKEQQARKAAASKFVKASSSKPTSQRVEKVKVKVEPQKKLPAGKTQKALPPGKTQKALPPGKKGGPVSTGNRPRRRNVKTNPPKGTQMGTKGGGVKGQPRLPKATIRSAGAASKALSTTGKVAGRISLPLSAYLELKGLKDSLDRGEGYARLPGIISKAVKGINKKKTTGAKTNSRGRRVGPVPAKPSTTPTKPRKRGMPNIPPKEGTGKGSPNDKPQRSSRPSPQPTSRPSPQPTSRPSPQRSSRPTRSKTGANDPRNAAYIAARKKLNANSTKAERDKVRDMGIKLFKGMHGNKSKSQSKKPAPKKRPLTAPIKKISETNFFKKKKE